MRAIVAVSILLLLAAPALALDVHGTWMIRTSTVPEVVEITQAGSTVSLTFSGVPISGALEASGRLAASGGTYPHSAQLDGDFSSSGDYLNATTSVFHGPTWSLNRTTFGIRCECVDGNFADGDGCDADCQVEPCWTCAGTPSVCTPSADGAACDAAACTSGETCSAGACAGGTPIVPCTDMSGAWNVHATNTFDGEPTVHDFQRVVRQRGNFVLVRDAVSLREYFGTIDPATGAYAWRRLGPTDVAGLCGSGNTPAIREPFSGTVAMNGQTFVATGTEVYWPTRCPLSVDVVEAGSRPCTGEGTACDTGNACVEGSTCVAGVCQGGAAVDCAACETCNPAAGCVGAPRNACAATGGPAKLDLKNGARDESDSLKWSWKGGPVYGSFGDPTTDSDYRLCVFDTTGTHPAVLFRSEAPAASSCGSKPCWKASANGSFSYENKAATPEGVKTLKLQPSDTKPSKVTLAAGGPLLSNRPGGLPSLPLPESLLVQLWRSDAGTCVEASYTPAGVLRNDAASGVFKARSE